MSLIIHKETVTDLLWDLLCQLMEMESLSSFRLVGGTALSLHIGHRKSVDIDLFTDMEYGTIDYEDIYKEIKSKTTYLSPEQWTNKTIGNSCFIGKNESNAVKLDLYGVEKFIFPIIQYKNIRISSLEEIVAMKLDVIGRGGRKKDFWDIHALLEKFSIQEMLNFYDRRYPYNFSRPEIRSALIDFKLADEDPDPNCLLGKYWELIKLDFEELVENQ